LNPKIGRAKSYKRNGLGSTRPFVPHASVPPLSAVLSNRHIRS
jgi:hypothetical protein